MDHYIAVTQIHDRPDITEPVRITKAGHPLTLSAKDAKDLGAAVRLPTPEEVKLFQLGDAPEPKATKAAAKAAEPAKKPAGKPAAEKKADADAADATKKAAEAQKAAETATGADAPNGTEDDTSGMV